MRVLILGGAGMLGHKLLQTLQNQFDTWVTVRTLSARLKATGMFVTERTISDVNGNDPDALATVVSRVRPDVVINAIGIVKQRPEADDPVESLSINSLLPHRVARLCEAAGARFIHVSTDCVFSGRAGAYLETDQSDAEDFYGRTKFLGEVTSGAALTLRTSMVGRELTSGAGLVEWFLAQDGRRIPGFTRARFSGLTTLALSRLVGKLLREQPELCGLYHVAADPISKYDLLVLLREAFGKSIEIEPRTEPAIDRTLDGSRFRHASGFVSTPWPEMVAELAADPTPYDEWRQSNAAPC
jgi:dTDP-4-dehydrorhamnose reductase